MHPGGLLRSSCSVLCHCPQIEGEHPGWSTGDAAEKLGEMWNSDKQPCDKKAAELKEKYEKDSAVYKVKGKPAAEGNGQG